MLIPEEQHKEFIKKKQDKIREYLIESIKRKIEVYKITEDELFGEKNGIE